jgi:hypothetical protein
MLCPAWRMIALCSAGRAGKYGELIGKNGGHYCGEILAGRPHGNGQYFVPAGPSARNYRLQYDGEWIQGRREGHGIRYYHTSKHAAVPPRLRYQLQRSRAVEGLTTTGRRSRIWGEGGSLSANVSVVINAQMRCTPVTL